MSKSPLRVTSRIVIPPTELRLSFVRSSGPGGQNVNKVASKVQLRWRVSTSIALPEDVRERFVARFGRRLTERGELLITSQRYRDQAKNIHDCLAKLRAMVLTAVEAPRRRKKTTLPRAARESRLREKRAQSEKKQRRRRPQNVDE